jgi:hypothetical protein
MLSPVRCAVAQAITNNMDIIERIFKHFNFRNLLRKKFLALSYQMGNIQVKTNIRAERTRLLSDALSMVLQLA